MTPRTAIQIAVGIRAGTLKAADVLEEHLARIDARESDVHAFNLVMTDQARAAAAAIDLVELWSLLNLAHSSQYASQSL